MDRNATGGKVQLVPKIGALKFSQVAEFSFIQFMKCTEHLDEKDIMVVCMYVRCTIKDKLDKSLGAKPHRKTSKALMTLEWLGMEPFDNMEGTGNLVCLNH